MAVRIGLVHSVLPAIGAVEAAFDEIWPAPDRANLLDQSLYMDLAPDRSMTPEIYRRVAALLRYSAEAGADAILVTGSLFGPAVVEGRKDLDIPVLTSFDGLIDEAFGMGERFATVSTDPGTNRMLAAEIEQRAGEAGKSVTLDPVHVDEAMALLQSGDRARHDALVVEAASDLEPCDAILLGQFSMGPTRPLVAERTGRPVLGAPEAAVRKLRALFDG
ncbi:MAG: aspartate/glutamate racemase family protein [Alphaproteobacteria bacterium]|nr:aspartate/glutamate racemase family protein [Alphaproteobacteria bacterium]